MIIFPPVTIWFATGMRLLRTPLRTGSGRHAYRKSASGAPNLFHLRHTPPVIENERFTGKHQARLEVFGANFNPRAQTIIRAANSHIVANGDCCRVKAPFAGYRLLNVGLCCSKHMYAASVVC